VTLLPVTLVTHWLGAQTLGAEHWLQYPILQLRLQAVPLLTYPVTQIEHTFGWLHDVQFVILHATHWVKPKTKNPFEQFEQVPEVSAKIQLGIELLIH